LIAAGCFALRCIWNYSEELGLSKIREAVEMAIQGTVQEIGVGKERGKKGKKGSSEKSGARKVKVQ
jgi:hypothetical protein